MLRNAAAVAVSFTLDPPTGVADATPSTSQVGMETMIGEAVAAAAAAISAGLIDYQQDNELSPAMRAWSGAMLGRVAQLQLATFGEFDFEAVARKEGRALLRATYLHNYDGHLDEAQFHVAIDEIIDWVLTIASNVVREQKVTRAQN